MSKVKSRLESISREGFDFRIGEFISQGFTIFGKNAAMFVGFLMLSTVVAVLSKSMIYIGDLASFITNGAWGAGYFIVAHKTYRNQNADFSNFFDGFKNFLPLFLNTLLVSALFLVGLIPALVFFAKNYGFGTGFNFQNPDELSELVQNFGLLYAGLYIVAMLLLSLFVIYSSLFIVFDKMNVFDALGSSAKIVYKSLFSHIIFVFIWLLILMVSCIPLFLGLFATIPAFYCSIYYAWQDITRFEDNEISNDDLMDHLIG
jgi:uncharacterized membrane protein